MAATTIVVGVLWFGSVFLMALNRGIWGILQGVVWRRLLKFRENKWKRRFQKEAEPLLRLQRESIEAYRHGKALPLLPVQFGELLLDAVNDYSDSEEAIMPTKFGNMYRALEAYSRILYGIDGVAFWIRLQAVLPEQFAKQLAEAKSRLDFFVNLTVGAGIVTLLYGVLAVWTRQLPDVWVVLITAIASVGSYRASIFSLRDYAGHVHCAYDFYRGDLAKQLGLELPESAYAEREMWINAARAMVYRSLAHAELLQRFRAPKPVQSAENEPS